jgi:hypothetical protein
VVTVGESLLCCCRCVKLFVGGGCGWVLLCYL